MPELPEVEAWRVALDQDVKLKPIAAAGPAHIATLKTFDPPLAELAGKRFAGAAAGPSACCFPTDDGELVLMVHLMSAGRIRSLVRRARRARRRRCSGSGSTTAPSWS